MIGQSLVFVCASLAVVAGSCIDIPLAQTCGFSPVMSFGSPLACVPQLQSGGLCSDNILSSSIPCHASGFSSAFPLTEGPGSSPVTVLQAPSATIPTLVTPVIGLPTQPIPAPRVIAQRCICTKTVVKPQIIQRQITVPRLQRYLKRTVTPVIENIAYKCAPVCRGHSAGHTLSSGCGFSEARCASSCTPVFSQRSC